jgi:hypothetical protein
LTRSLQLVSNVPLTAEEAAVVHSAEGFPAGGAGAVSPQVTPSGQDRAAGQPTGRTIGRHPEPNTRENTSHHPARANSEMADADPGIPRPEDRPEGEQAPEPPAADHLVPDSPAAQARSFIGELPGLDPRLLVPRGMVAELIDLAARWLEAGHRLADARTAVRSGLPGRDQTIRKPGGLVRYLLRDVPPVLPTPTVPRAAGLRHNAPATAVTRPAHLRAAVPDAGVHRRPRSGPAVRPQGRRGAVPAVHGRITTGRYRPGPSPPPYRQIRPASPGDNLILRCCESAVCLEVQSWSGSSRRPDRRPVRRPHRAHRRERHPGLRQRPPKHHVASD